MSLRSKIHLPKPNNALYTQKHLLDYNIYQMIVVGIDTCLSLVPCLQLLMNAIYNHLYKITSHNLLVCTLQFQLKWQHIQAHLIMASCMVPLHLTLSNLYGTIGFLTLWNSPTVIAYWLPLDFTIPYNRWFITHHVHDVLQFPVVLIDRSHHHNLYAL